MRLLRQWHRTIPILAAIAVYPTPSPQSRGLVTGNHTCRAQPGDSAFPTPAEFSAFNSSVGGRLITVVPSAEFCKSLPGGCTDNVWANLFKGDVPGAMLQVNWEQDYASNPPSLCFRNSTVCGQGSVPLYAVNATTAAHIQAGVRFAQTHNLRVAIKASGHDYLGHKGSAVTVGSGVGLHTLYQAAKTHGKTYVGGTAATVVPAGGYLQGAGHSALSPLLGLAADNVLEFQVVLADGRLVTANEVSHPDLFWALRGGGAGSWGVIISATIRTFPTFNIVQHQVLITTNSSAAVGELAVLHAQHIFDWDVLHVGQYFYVNGSTAEGAFTWFMSSYFPGASPSCVNASLGPFLEGASARGFGVTVFGFGVGDVNDALSSSDNDGGGIEAILGSRLIPINIYRHDTAAIGKAYQDIFDAGTFSILGHLVAGGQVSKNANINSAVNPKWRTAKTHIILVASWLDTTSPADVEGIREDFTNKKMPILEALAGPGSGSYSNEGDVREPDFQTTFFGPNYARLSGIKRAYDPHDLFIVGAGVGSERWDAEGLCKVL